MSIVVSITDLMQAVGSDNIRFQYIDTSMERIDIKKDVTVVSFATDAITPTDVVMGGGPKGFVIWVDRELVRERLEQLKQSKLVTYEMLQQQRDELLGLVKAVVYHSVPVTANGTRCAAFPWVEYEAMVNKAKGGAE